MLRFSISCMLLVVLISVDIGEAQESIRSEVHPRFRIAGYLPEYRFAEFNASRLSGLSDLILFSAEPTTEGGLDVRRLDQGLCPWTKLWALKAQQRVQLHLTIGGWDRSRHFAKVASDQPTRERFAKEVVNYCLVRRLDGVDIDWEHPQDATEEENYGLLLAALRKELGPYTLRLTATAAAWQKLTPLAIESVDAVQVMAYDHDDEHSTFAGYRRDIETLLKAGVPAHKLVVGLPFYGRDIKTRDATTYAQVMQTLMPNADVDRVGNLYFNGADLIRKKTRDAKSKGLAGVMVWELGQDAPGDQSLLRVIVDAAAQ